MNPLARPFVKKREPVIRQALREWQTAANNFDNSTESAFIDFAVYGMEAAKRRFVLLFKAEKAAAARRLETASAGRLNPETKQEMEQT